MSQRFHDIQVLQAAIQAVRPIGFLIYDRNWRILSQNNPLELPFDLVFAASYRDWLSERIASGSFCNPLLLTDGLKLSYLCFPETDTDGTLIRTHVMGPVFFDSFSARQTQQVLDLYLQSIKLRHELFHNLSTVPVVYSNTFFEYGAMYHKILTGERIAPSDIISFRQAELAATAAVFPHKEMQRHGTWEAEQRMLRAFEEGNLEYKAILDELDATGHAGQVSTEGSFDQARTLNIVFITLVSRASIRGGLSPEIGLSLADQYLQENAACTTLWQLWDVGTRMAEDYIQRVHECRQKTGISSLAREIQQYVQSHYREHLTVADLAAYAGYSVNHLSSRFRDETGQLLSDYILEVRLNAARDLLRDTSRSVGDVCEELQFPSQSHFGVLFKRRFGVTPGQYQKQGQSSRPTE